MKTYFRSFGGLVLIGLLCLLINSCGGSGGGSSTSGPPFIAAELDSFPTGSIPVGFTNGASVAVLDNFTGASITTATVIMNGVTLAYNAIKQEYEGNVLVAPGATVTLRVTVGGSTYTASSTQFTTYPTISAPVSGTTWYASSDNAVTWSGGAPSANAFYGLGVLDADDPNSGVIWPLGHFLQEVSISTNSYTVPAYRLTAGNRLVIVGIAKTEDIPGAAFGSSLLIGGFNYAPVTIIAPTTLASGLSGACNIAIDSTSVYWADCSAYNGPVNKVGINGGTVTTLALGQGGPWGIAVDSTSVYWTEQDLTLQNKGTVKKVGINGGPVTTLASGLTMPMGIAVDSTHVYWAEMYGGTDGTIKKVGINGGTVTVLASGLQYGGPKYIVVDSNSVYWAELYGRTIKKVGINGGTVTTLASGLNGPEGIAVDSTSVYWADIANYGYNGAIQKVGINGGTVTTLASGLNGPEGIAVDSTSIYWTDLNSGTVKKVGINGGPVTTLASGLNMPMGIAVDSTHVYWATCGDYDYNNGTIQKILK